MASTKTRTKRVKLYPAGLGRRNLHRWKTRPMTRELMDEIIRVRTRLAEASRPKTSRLSPVTQGCDDATIARTGT